MTDVNNITNYNNGPIDLSEINTFNEEIERLNNKCREAGINVQINAEHLHDPNNINLLIQNKHNEVLKQNDASVKIDVAYYDYGKSPEKVLHANILIRYKGKMFFFDTTPRFHDMHNSEADQTNKTTIFQKDYSSCYVKSLKNVELFIDLIKTNPAILENTNVTNNFLRLDYSELPQLEINRNVSVELQEIERTKNLFLNAPLFAIANSDILTLKNQYFDYLIKENRLLNSENRINALEDLEKEDLTNIELTKFDKEEIDTRLKTTNDSLKTSDIEQSKSINNFMLKQMVCQQIHQTSFDEYDLTENYLIITISSQEKRYLTVDKFLNSLARTKQLLNFVKYCQDLPKLKEHFINNTMKTLYPNNPEARGLVENIAKDITVDDLINSLPATNEFQNILITFNKFCKEHNLENSYQNLLEFNKQNLKDHLQLMEIKSENKFDSEALQSLKEAAETMDLNVNFHKEKLIPEINTATDIKNDQQLYLEGIKTLPDQKTIDYDKIQRHHEIIAVYANKESKNKLIESDTSEPEIIKNDKKTNLGLDNCLYTTDIHGDLSALLFTLVGNKDSSKNPAIFGKPEEVYYDIRTKKVVDINTIKKEDRPNLVPIPNLIPNPEFKGKFVFGGDLIDRGEQSESCFYTMANLLQEQSKTKETKIEFLIGNHEDFLLNDKSDDCEINGGNITYGKRLHEDFENRFKYMRQAMLELVQNDQVKLCSSEKSTIISHVSFVKSDINLLINTLKKNLDSPEKFTEIGIKEEEFEGLKTLQTKINKDEKLDEKAIQLLAETINKVAKYNYRDGISKEYEAIFQNDKGHGGLLWNRIMLGGTLNDNKLKNNTLNGLIQIFGHEINYLNNVYNDGKYVFFAADNGQSDQINPYLPEKEKKTEARNLIFENGNIKVQKCTHHKNKMHEIFEEQEKTQMQQQAAPQPALAPALAPQPAQVPKPETKPQQSKIKTVELEPIKVLTDTEIFNNIQNDPNKISQQTIQDQVFNSPGLLTSCINNPKVLKVILNNIDFTMKILGRQNEKGETIISRELKNEFFIKAIENNNKAAIAYLALNISNNAPDINKNYFTQLVLEQPKCFDILYEQIFIKKENLENFPKNFQNQVEQKLFNEIKANLDLINTRKTQEQIFYSPNILYSCMNNPEILQKLLKSNYFVKWILDGRNAEGEDVISQDLKNKFLIKAIENKNEIAIKYLVSNIKEQKPSLNTEVLIQLVLEQPKCIDAMYSKIFVEKEYFYNLPQNFKNQVETKFFEKIQNDPNLIGQEAMQDKIFNSPGLLTSCMDSPKIMKKIVNDSAFTLRILNGQNTNRQTIIKNELRNKFLIKAIENNSEIAIKCLSVNVNDKAPIDTKNYFTQLVFEQPKCVGLLCEKIHGYSQYFAADFVNSLLNKLDEQFDSPPASVFKNASSEIDLLLSKSRIQNIQQ